MGTKVQQRQILALLLAVAALVLPVSGAVLYIDAFAADSPMSPGLLPFMGAANESDVLGPVLLAGALALGVLVIRRDGGAGPVPRALLATVIVMAAVSQGAAFLVGAFDLATSDAYEIPSTAAWTAAQWSIILRYLVQAAVCAAAIAYGMRWLAPDDRTAPS